MDWKLGWQFQIAISGFLGAYLFGVFLFGSLSRSKRASNAAEGILCMAMGGVLAVVGWRLQFGAIVFFRFSWMLLLVLLFGGGVYRLWQSRKA